MATLNLPPNSRPLYRIMAMKSRMMFGKYPDLLVSDVLKVDRSYLPWCYFCLANVSFNDEVLAELGITQKIAKPGTSEQGWEDWKKAYREGFTEEERQHGRWVFRAKQKARARAKLAEAERAGRISKGRLQAANHGHIKIK